MSTYYTKALISVLDDARKTNSIINFSFSSGCNVKTKTFNLNRESANALKDLLYNALKPTNNLPFSIYGMRLSGIDKNYYLSQLQQFANAMSLKSPASDSVEYGKQDTRGGFSICILEPSGCVVHQKTFESKQEMLGFICGYNSANSNQAYL